MIFGETSGFGIEAEFLEVSGKWTFGHLRFWLQSVALGDFEDTSDLASSARGGRIFLAASAQRTRPDLDAEPAAAVFEHLYGRFMQSVHDPVIKPWPGSWDRDPYLLDDVGESALRDDFAVVVTRGADGRDRMIAMCYEEEQLLEALLPAGTCDRVIDEYCSWVESLRSPTSA
jgi:hypothetical protein